MTLQVYYIYLVLIEVQAVLRSPPFPQVQFPREYMRFRAHLLSRRYSFYEDTCDFTLIPFYARTIPAGVHAVLHSPLFPQVQFPRMYMRIHTFFLFRRYSFLGSTCGFALTSFPTGTVSTNVYAFLHSSPFTHVQFPQEYMRFCTHLLPRTYSSRRSTCDFFFTSFSTGTGIRYSLLRLVTRINIKKGCLCSSSKKCLQAI